jgi:hypothetical protein
LDQLWTAAQDAELIANVNNFRSDEYLLLTDLEGKLNEAGGPDFRSPSNAAVAAVVSETWRVINKCHGDETDGQGGRVAEPVAHWLDSLQKALPSETPTSTIAPVIVTTTTVRPTTTTTGLAERRPHDKHFAVAGLQLKQDYAGNFGGTAQVQNIGIQSYTAVFKWTFTRNGQVLGTAEGSADGVSPGQTVSVEFISQDKYDGGPVSYTFQVDTEYGS